MSLGLTKIVILAFSNRFLRDQFRNNGPEVTNIDIINLFFVLLYVTSSTVFPTKSVQRISIVSLNKLDMFV